MPTSNELLIQIPDLENKIKSLTERLGQDSALLQRFGAKPAELLVEEIFPDQDLDLSEVHLSASNRFLQGALSNQAFRDWAAAYQKDLYENATSDDGSVNPAKVDRRKILEDIGSALIATGDQTLVADWSDHLASSSPRAWDSVVVTDDIAVVTKAAALLLVVVTAIDVTPYAPDRDRFVAPADIRALADAIVSTAKASRE
jgi:hypothetical protein